MALTTKSNAQRNEGDKVSRVLKDADGKAYLNPDFVEKKEEVKEVEEVKKEVKPKAVKKVAEKPAEEAVK